MVFLDMIGEISFGTKIVVTLPADVVRGAHPLVLLESPSGGKIASAAHAIVVDVGIHEVLMQSVVMREVPHATLTPGHPREKNLVDGDCQVQQLCTKVRFVAIPKVEL